MSAPSPIIAPSGNEVVILNQTFRGIDEAISFAIGLANAHERRRAFSGIADVINEAQQQYQAHSHRLYEAAREDEEVKEAIDAVLDDATHDEHDLWQVIVKGHMREKDRLTRLETLRKAISKSWGNEAREVLIPMMQNAAGNRLKELSAIVNQRHGVRWQDLRPLLRDAIFERLTGAAQGMQKGQEIFKVDFENAIKKLNEKVTPHSLSYYRARGYRLDDDGWIAKEIEPVLPDITGPRISEVASDDDDDEIMKSRQGMITASAHNEEEYIYDTDMESDEAASEHGAPSDVSQPEADKPVRTEPAKDGRQLRSAKRTREQRLSDEGSHEGEADEDANQTKRARHDDVDAPEVADEDLPTEKLVCKCVNIPAEFKSQARKTIGFKDNATQHTLARKYVAHMSRGASICYKHTHATAANVGFQVKRSRHGELIKMLKDYVTALDAGQLYEYKTTRGLFRRSHRAALPEDGLGPYRFAHQPITFELTPDMQATLQDEMNVDMDLWNAEGSVNMPCFDWMEDYSLNMIREAQGLAPREDDLTIHNMVKEEFEMYRYHQRLVNGKANMGWLRNALFSLGQQAMRMSLRYYAYYVALRPDRCHRLISYPYYAKYQTAEDGSTTYFRHIDIAVEAAVTRGRGINAIQGSLSLDDEYEDDCTEILPGLHARMAEWHARIKDRPVYTSDPAAFVSRITEHHYTADDKIHFGIDWKPVPCNALEVRITDSRLPHGAQAAKRIRRTMLPWFCGVDKDGSLEMPEAGTADELATAHRDLMPGRSTPSGLANRYSAIPYAFPAAVQLPSTNVLSESLVGRVHLDQASLIMYKTRFLTDATFRNQEMANNEIDMARDMFLKWEEVKQLEMYVFKDKSYFYKKQQGLPLVWDKNDQDRSANDEEYALELPHGGTTDEGVMVGSDVVIVEETPTAGMTVSEGDEQTAADSDMRQAMADSMITDEQESAGRGMRRSMRLRTRRSTVVM